MSRATIRDVSREARTSIATVSKVLNQGPESCRISPACRQRVLQACERLGYVPQQAGRSLRTGRSYAVGGLVNIGGQGDTPRLTSLQFYAPVVNGMLHAAFGRGLQFMAVTGRAGQGPVETGLSFLRQKLVDGLVVSGAFTADWSDLAACMRDGEAVVLAGWPVPENVPVHVDIDEITPMGEAVAMLFELGHRVIAWLGPNSRDNPYAERRHQAFVSMLSAHGLSPRELRLPSGRTGTRGMEDEIAVLVPPLLEWLQCPHRPTAVIAYNETFALALYESARRNGLGIPDDLSVVAFDDIHAAAALPAMTVVSLELFGVGARALELCADMIDGKRSVPPDGRLVEHVRGRLAVRNSHGPAPK